MADFPRHPFLLSVPDVAKTLGTDVDKGLSNVKVVELQKYHPPNVLDTGDGIAAYKIMAKQLLNAMILASYPNPHE